MSDMKVSRAFYEDLLEQEVLADFGENIPFTSGFSLWQADHALNVVYKGKHTSLAKLGQDTMELYFENPDLDAPWARIRKAWPSIIHPIEEAP